MTMRLADLVAGLDARVEGPGGVGRADRASDSRAIRPGMLFAALRGAQADGHAFAGPALEQGASALLVEEWSGARPPHAAIVRVPDTRRALADVSARFFGQPAQSLLLAGVTGTNGKTSTVRMLESILLASGRSAGSLGTVDPDAAELADGAQNIGR